MIKITLITGKEIEIENTSKLTAKDIKDVLCSRTHLLLYNCIFKVDDISAIEVIE